MRSNENSIVPQPLLHSSEPITNWCWFIQSPIAATPKGYLCTYSPVVHGRRGKSTVITTSVLHLDGQVIILCPRHVMGALSRYVKFLHLSSIIFVEYFHMQPQKRNILLQILWKIHHFSKKIVRF